MIMKFICGLKKIKPCKVLICICTLHIVQIYQLLLFLYVRLQSLAELVVSMLVDR